jgi:hypothetical protein
LQHRFARLHAIRTTGSDGTLPVNLKVGKAADETTLSAFTCQSFERSDRSPMATANLNTLQRRPFQWHNRERRLPTGQYPALLRPLARLQKNVGASAPVGHQNCNVLIKWSRFCWFPHSPPNSCAARQRCPYNEFGYETFAGLRAWSTAAQVRKCHDKTAVVAGVQSGTGLAVCHNNPCGVATAVWGRFFLLLRLPL